MQLYNKHFLNISFLRPDSIRYAGEQILWTPIRNTTVAIRQSPDETMGDLDLSGTEHPQQTLLKTQGLQNDPQKPANPFHLHRLKASPTISRYCPKITATWRLHPLEMILSHPTHFRPGCHLMRFYSITHRRWKPRVGQRSDTHY